MDGQRGTQQGRTHAPAEKTRGMGPTLVDDVLELLGLSLDVGLGILECLLARLGGRDGLVWGN